jgi:hypothetical protein
VAPSVPAELGNLALDLERVTAREAAPPPLVLVAGPFAVEAARPPEPAPRPLTLVPPTETAPAHHAVPAALPAQLLTDVIGWAAFAVVVAWAVIMASGHGLASASAWAGSLLGLVLTAVAVLALVGRPRRAPGSRAGRED